MTQEQFNEIDNATCQGIVDIYMANKEYLRDLQAKLLSVAAAINKIDILNWSADDKMDLQSLIEINKEIIYKLGNLSDVMRYCRTAYFRKANKWFTY